MELLSQTKSFFALLSIVLLLMFFMLWSYLTPIVLALTFLVLFNPLYKKILFWTKGNANISASLTILLIFIFVFTPIILLGFQIFNEASLLYAAYNNNPQALSDTVAHFQDYLTKLFPFADSNVAAWIRQGAYLIVNNLSGIFSSAISLFIDLLLTTILLYFLFKNGAEFYRFLITFSPLEGAYTKQILHTLTIAISSVIKGSLFIAFIQGIACMIGFTLFGVPEPFLWGTLTGFAALIPPVGTLFVIIPASLYLFSLYGIVPAVGMFIWGSVGVALIDNLLRPLIIQRAIQIPPIFILFSILGGISFFGPIGFLLGPLVLSVLHALLELYPSIIISRDEEHH